MTNPSEPSIRSLAFYGAIEHAVSQKASTAEIWQVIRDQAAAAGLAQHGVTIQDVNRLRGAAVATRTANQRLATADARFGGWDQLSSVAPYARGLTERNALPMYQVRFEHTTETNGQPGTEWKTVMIRSELPSTVADLRDLIDRRAEQLANEYGANNIGTGSISVLAV